jgi:hypothetical protein
MMLIVREKLQSSALSLGREMGFIQRNILASSVIVFVIGAAAVLIGTFGNELLGTGRRRQRWQKLDDDLDEALAHSMNASDSTAKF